MAYVCNAKSLVMNGSAASIVVTSDCLKKISIIPGFDHTWFICRS